MRVILSVATFLAILLGGVPVSGALSLPPLTVCERITCVNLPRARQEPIERAFAPIPPTEPQVRGSAPQRASGGSLRRSIAGVECWRSTVSAYFPAHAVDEALSVMAGESGGDPNAKNPHSTASGLFQLTAVHWQRAGYDPFDPATNCMIAAMLYRKGGWSAWVCQP